MNFIARLLGRRPQAQAPAPSAPALTSRDATRRELAAMALRDTLRKHGIPQGWIAGEASPVLTARKERGVHLRLVLRHWHPALPACLVALQKSIASRLNRLDPLSCDWLVGISWKFELADETACPALPQPAFWDGAPAQPALAAVKPQHAAREPAHALKRMLAQRDDAFADRARQAADFSPTQPMLLPGTA
jgi:hypothetical protein